MVQKRTDDAKRLINTMLEVLEKENNIPKELNEFKYPAIEPQIKQLAQILGLDPNRIVMMATPYEESLDNYFRRR